MTIKAKMKFGARGYYSLKKLNARGDAVDDGAINTVNNTVSTAGAVYILSRGYIFSSMKCRVGTGVTELTADSTDLTSPLPVYTDRATASRAGAEVDNGDGTSTITVTREMSFSLGAVVGTFSEIGIYYYGDRYVAGQLIKDEFGDPTTITVLEDEQLVITYTLEWTVPNKPALLGTGTLTDSANNTYDYELWGQPYFRDYTVGASSEEYRAGNFRNTECYNADGSHNGRASSSGGGSSSTSGTTFTRTSYTGTVPPNGRTFKDAYFISVGERASNRALILTDGEVAAPDSEYSSATVIMKLLTPMSKTDQESFSLKVSVEYTV